MLPPENPLQNVGSAVPLHLDRAVFTNNSARAPRCAGTTDDAHRQGTRGTVKRGQGQPNQVAIMRNDKGRTIVS
jgi:hypothetical protein